MDYSKIIELDNVTAGDCIDAYRYRGLRAIINDGRVINFVNEGMEDVDNAYYNG